MRHHIIQTSFAMLAIAATGVALYAGVGESMAQSLTHQTQSSAHVYTGTTPQLPDVQDRAHFSILTTPVEKIGTNTEEASVRVPYYVTSVIDGNTVVADGRVRIRLVGIKAPDKDEELGVEATDFLKEQVEGKEIFFEPDSRNPKDSFGRLRGVIYAKDKNINTLMLENGMAQLYPVSPSSIHTDSWIEYVTLAREQKRGLWGDVTATNKPDDDTKLTDTATPKYEEMPLLHR